MLEAIDAAAVVELSVIPSHPKKFATLRWKQNEREGGAEIAKEQKMWIFEQK
jgi:hypothetical protein